MIKESDYHYCPHQNPFAPDVKTLNKILNNRQMAEATRLIDAGYKICVISKAYSSGKYSITDIYGLDIVSAYQDNPIPEWLNPPENEITPEQWLTDSGLAFWKD